MANSATRLGVLVLGVGALGTGVLAAAIAGSNILKGDLIFDTTDNSTPSIVLDTSDAVTFNSPASGDVKLELGDLEFDTTSNTSPCVMVDGVGMSCFGYASLTATGGSAAYVIGTFTNPRSATGSIDAVEIQVSTAPTDGATYADCYVVAGAATSTGGGTALFNSESLTAGLHKHEPGSTEVRIGNGQKVLCASTVGTGTNLVGRLAIWWHEVTVD